MELNIIDIKRILPHSYPFLLIDRVIECDPGKSIKAIKNVTFNEPFFIGHFPNNPIMPGVLIVESLAQAAAVCVLSTKNTIKEFFLASIENAKFRQQVTPGDTLTLRVNVMRSRDTTCKFECFAYVDTDDKPVAEAIILAML